MKNLILLACVGLLATACATTTTDDDMAADSQMPAEPAVENAADAEGQESTEPAMRRLCRSERVTGSNRPRRTCRMVPVTD